MNAHFTTLTPEAGSESDDTLTVTLFHDPEAGVWCASSDDIPIATEATTIDAVINQVWMIAPEIADLNGLPSHDMRLRFVMDTQPVPA
jgi:hypothetical protein